VNFGRTTGLLTAIRGGGHNGGGLGTCDDGLVIDLSRMKGIRVDPSGRTVRVEPGCTGGEMDHATHAFGLATPGGTVSTTGVAGLTLGGGIGHLTRAFGLAIDNLLEVDMVLADGRFVTANTTQNSDLFWAVRGGGGNFGVVTSFLFRLQPVTTVMAGPTFWPIEQTPEVMKAYQEFILKAPEDINGFLAFLTVPAVPLFPPEIHGRKVCAIIWCSTAAAEKVERVTKPMRSVGTPLLDHVGPLPFPAVQSLFDPLLPSGMQWYWRADFVKTFNADAIATHLAQAMKAPAGLSQVHIYPIDGAAHRVGIADTAFSYRDANFAVVIVGIDPDPANRDTITRWCKDYFDAVHPYSAGGAYINFMMEEGQERVQASFRDNYARLAMVKNKYDPMNLFRVNQNIRPAAVV
jgi:FAD/FMN-containing dehydrogenase